MPRDGCVGLLSCSELCSAPGARWMPFTAEQRMNATQSSFCWNARFGGRVGLLTVTDACEELHGRLVLKLGGVIPVKKFAGAEVDKGEMQRYLAEILMWPSILLHHSSLEFTVAGDRVLRVRDRQDSAGATVDYEINEEGRPVACRAERPRLAGEKTVLTPWSGACQEFQEWEGLRVARRLEVSWNPPRRVYLFSLRSHILHGMELSVLA